MAENRVEVLLTAKDQASKKINKNTQAMKGMTGASKTLGKSLSVLKGIAITAFAGWGVIKVSASIIKLGANFKYTMAVVRGVSRATGKEYKALEAIARKMGETTEWSASQAAEALKFLSMAGFSATKSIKALPATLDLATAGNIDLGRTADIVTNALTAMRLPVEELTRVSDVFIQTITSSNTNMEMMAESFKYAAPVAAGFGIKIERLSALIGLLGNAGIQGSMAGTQLSMAMMRAQEVFEKYGVSTRRADGSTKDFVDALEMLEARGGDVNEVLSVFAMRSGKAALALLGQGVPAIVKYIKEIENAEGATKRLADIIRNTAKIDWKILISVLESVAIDIWRKYEESAVNALKATAKWIGDNRDKIIEMVEAIGDIAKAVKFVLAPALNLLLEMGDDIAHMIIWVKNLSKALGLVSAGFLELSDVATANFEELQQLLDKFEMPDILKDLKLQAKEARKEIDRLKKGIARDEGIVFGEYAYEVEVIDKEKRLTETIKLLEDIQDRMASIREERFIKGLVTFKMPKPPEVSKEERLSSKEIFNAELKAMELRAFRMKDIAEIEKEYLEERYGLIEDAAKEAREIENEELRRAKEYLDYKLKEREKYYLSIEEMAQEARDFEEELEDEALRMARETAEYQKKLSDKKYGYMKDAMKGWASGFSNTLNDMLWGAEITFKEIAESFGRMITQMMIQKSIIEPMFEKGGGWFGALLGAAGGFLKGPGGGLSAGGEGLMYTAQGGAFPGGIDIYSNQVVKKPTQFAFAFGAGLMGEAGPEAIMPLTRTPDGDLGVKTEGGGDTNIMIIANDAKSFADMVKRNPESIVTVVGEALEERTGLRDIIMETL